LFRIHSKIHFIERNARTFHPFTNEKIKMELSESLAETLPALQRVFSTLHDREAMSLGIPTAEVSCIVDFSVSKGMRIEAGHTPIIRISAVWAYECVLYQKTDLLEIGRASCRERV
jgi:hypothetical protein